MVTNSIGQVVEAVPTNIFFFVDKLNDCPSMIQLLFFITKTLFMSVDQSVLQQCQQLIQPLLLRIQSLEKQNQELKERVRQLEAVVNPQRNYQKMTLSAASHMRDSRISSKDSDKRPGWNSKTKIDQSPLRSPEHNHHEKIKTKPPIPKVARSPAKQTVHPEDIRVEGGQKKIQGGTKFPAADNYQSKTRDLEGGQAVKVNERGKKGVHLIQTFSNKFEELVRQNNELIGSMKQEKEQLSPMNMVNKAGSPKSEYHHSHTTSPNSRSFVSQNPDKEKQMQAGDRVKGQQ